MNGYKVKLILCYNYPDMLGAIGEVVGVKGKYTLVDFPDHTFAGDNIWYCTKEQIIPIDDINTIVKWEDCVWQPSTLTIDEGI